MREEFMEEAQEWAQENPRLWWAFEQLNDDDDLRDRVLVGILKENMPAEVIDDLVRFADALEVRERAEATGTVITAPDVGMRRSIEITVTRMSKVNWSLNRARTFRVDFVTNQGWAGYFDTRNPRLVEQINKTLKRERQTITVVGEIEQHLYDFLVVLGGRVRIV